MTAAPPWGVPELRRRIGALAYTRAQKRALFAIVLDYGLDTPYGEGLWNGLESELKADPEKIHGFVTDLSASWEDRRLWACTDTAEMKEGNVTWFYGIGGSCKTGGALEMARKDHGAKLRSGLLQRIGTPQRYRLFTVDHYIPDAVLFVRDNREKDLPRGFTPVLDDPRYMYDAENIDAFEGAVPIIVEQATKGRRANVSIKGTDVRQQTSIVKPSEITHRVWMPEGLSRNGVRAHAVLMGHSSSEAFAARGFLTLGAPTATFAGQASGGFCEFDGPTFMEYCNKKKDEAHDAVFGKRKSGSHQSRDLRAALLSDPGNALAHCVNDEMRYVFLSDFLANQYNYQGKGVEAAREKWWTVMRVCGHVGKVAKKETYWTPPGGGEPRDVGGKWCLFDTTGPEDVVLYVRGMAPDPVLADRLVVQWATRLDPDHPAVSRAELRPLSEVARV